MLLLVISLAGCANMGGSGSGAPYAEMEQEFIPDASPIGNPKTTRLAEFAATLPIYDSKDRPALIRSGKAGVESSAAWALPGEGSQAPVHIQRLRQGPQGAQRIKVRIGPTRSSIGAASAVWVYELERKPGGWKQLLSL